MLVSFKNFESIKPTMVKDLVSKIALGTCVMVLWTSCGNNSSKSENTIVDTVTTTQADTLQHSGSTNEFASKATIGGMTEVEMGKLAESNGGNADVKEYGKMLQKDHAAANNDLRSIADAEKITLPTAIDEKHSDNIKDMSSKKGADFDKAFIPMMIEDHENDIAEFKEAATSNPSQKIKDFASKALPTLQKHLDKAKMIKSKMK